jgi:hypothetical protein
MISAGEFDKRTVVEAMKAMEEPWKITEIRMTGSIC